ncbi:SMP-30/gluconolactonase/LRE family protein [Coraliomargarita akajimensis]|uniref:SMP-30/Gluconolaconase/LRE domain protein n=1 Tax=Coraliomargarita akajimensis (strain DSM 45221 / IAM 15411 / JCM 23193 / KCTC 12865 / 04OKA010-24) TaxID=583355 RepID=D5EJG4_CORAD|nr:SMP-30/gluconolactonase/LRE family protein [Coraliomargarita akajimensis]ADE54563.1 SMP-30/Gluconolaconase/LRE domain protein [Coraliomargarita akajimensis DSM 45221]
MPTTTVRTIGARISKWGEGPIWWNNSLLYVDIEGHAIIQLNPETEEETIWNIGERIGTVVPTECGSLLYAGDTGIIRFDPQTGNKAPLGDPEAELRSTNRFNDGKCDPAGRFWAGSISLVKDPGTAKLYCLEANGELSVKIPEVTNSNGLCWSADATRFYYIDTPTKQVRCYDYDETSGNISNAVIAIDTQALGFKDSPDGMTIDSEGMLWIAFCHGGCVARFNPATGELLHKVDLPCVETTACAFGGPQLDRLFVTTGIHKSIDEADAGKVFVIDGLGVTGLPAFAYKG